MATHHIPFRHLLDTPHDRKNIELNEVIQSHLKRNHIPFPPSSASPMPQPLYFWPDEHFNLHRSSIFRQATLSQQEEILILCSRHILQEAYSIEKLGLAFCAKMILSADTTEEAQTYSLIAADEATHLDLITTYTSPEDRSAIPSAFIRFISSLIEQCPKNLLVFLVQIILEGWGVRHYGSIAATCRHLPLRKIFNLILRDEALHYRTGQVLFNPQKHSATEQSFMTDCLHRYFEFVQVGPQAVARVVDHVLGGMTWEQKIRLFTELESERISKNNIDLLQSFITQSGIALDGKSFKSGSAPSPYTPAQCAATLDGSIHQGLPHEWIG